MDDSFESTAPVSSTKTSSKNRISRLQGNQGQFQKPSRRTSGRKSSATSDRNGAQDDPGLDSELDNPMRRRELRQERIQRLRGRKGATDSDTLANSANGGNASTPSRGARTPMNSNVPSTPRIPLHRKDPLPATTPTMEWQHSPVLQRTRQRQSAQLTQPMPIQPVVLQKQRIHELYEQKRNGLKKMASPTGSGTGAAIRAASESISQPQTPTRKPDPEPSPSSVSRSLSRRRAAAAASNQPRVSQNTTPQAPLPNRINGNPQPQPRSQSQHGGLDPPQCRIDMLQTPRAKARTRPNPSPNVQAQAPVSAPIFTKPLRSETKTDDLVLVPSGNESTSFIHLHGASPRSGMDGLTAQETTFLSGVNVSGDQGDDDATLTSVRRIMGGENNPSNGDEEFPNLQTSFDYLLRNDDSGTAMSFGPSTISLGRTPSSGGQHSVSSRRRRTQENGRFGDVKHSGSGTTLEYSTNTSGSGSERPRQQAWLEEEKVASGSTDVFRSVSSSDYDTDADLGKLSRISQKSTISIDGPMHSHESGTDYYGKLHSVPSGERSKTGARGHFVQGRQSRDEGSIGSESYATRQYQSQHINGPLLSGSPNSTNPAADSFVGYGDSPLINKDDVKHYTKSLDTPAMKVSAGVVTAATFGCVVLGPVGLLVGAAAVGIGVGVMQIPEEQRNNMQEKAKKAINEMHDKAVDASEKLSTSCAATYQDSGMAEHLPQCINVPDLAVSENDSIRSESARRNVNENAPLGGPQHPSAQPRSVHDPSPAPPPNDGRIRSKKVACFRNAPVIPCAQIHALDPGAQPRAWLDVMASAKTTPDEKNEAMEEILILAKDKRRARIFLDEGILDSIMWILYRHLEKMDAQGKDTNWANPAISNNEHFTAKLAATCCVTLGKAHCAAVHTEGDLLLMSLYERGTVPEERQVAQMLHEVPHHVRVSKISDPTVVDPSNEVFALKQLTLPQAEELARSIKAVADTR